MQRPWVRQAAGAAVAACAHRRAGKVAQRGQRLQRCHRGQRGNVLQAMRGSVEEEVVIVHREQLLVQQFERAKVARLEGPAGKMRGVVGGRPLQQAGAPGVWTHQPFLLPHT